LLERDRNCYNHCRQFHEESDTSITVHKENILNLIANHRDKITFTLHDEIIFQITDHGITKAPRKYS